MRIDFSEPECSTCFHNRTSGVLNPRVPEPPSSSNVIASSVTSTPVSSEPAQALGHDSAAAAASTSTSSSAQALAFGHDSPAAVASTSTAHSSSPHGSVRFSLTSSPAHSSSPHGSVKFSFGPDSSAPTQAHGFTTSGSVQAPDSSAAPTPSIFGSTQAPGALFGGPKPSTSVFGFGGASATFTSSPAVGFSYNRTHPVNSASTQPFGPNTPPPSLWSAQAHPFGSSLFAAPTPSAFGRSMEAPAFGSSGFAAPTPSPFGSSEQAPAFGFGSGVASATSSSSTSASSAFSQPFGPNTPPPSLWSAQAHLFGSSLFPAPTPRSVEAPAFGSDFPKTGCVVPPSTTPKNPFSSLFPGFGDDYLPGTPSNVFRVNPPSTTPVSGGGPVCTGVKPSSSQPSGVNAFSSNHNTGSSVFATHQWDVREQGTGNPRYAPTPYTEGPFTDPLVGKANMISISASFSYQDKSHEELRWEDYKKGVKGGSFPADPFTRFQGAQRPHETNAVSSPASGCTACGATSSSSASGYSGSNVATHGSRPTMNGTTNFVAQGTTTTTTPAFQAYAMMMPWMYPMMHPMMHPMMYPMMHPTPLQAYPTMYGANAAAQGTTTTPGLQAYPTMYGANAAAQGTTATPGLQAYPMMYGADIAVQVTTPPGQAYPVHGLILLPFAAMNLQ